MRYPRNPLLATHTYDALGRRSSVTFGNGSVRSYGYDAESQLTQLTNNLPGTANDLTLTFGYNPAGQIAENVRSNDAYAWTQHYNIDRLTSVDGLNRILNTSVGGATMASFGHDARGNLTSSTSGGVTSTYSYNIDNMLTAGPNGATLAAKPSGCVIWFDYDPKTLELGPFRWFGAPHLLLPKRDADAIFLLRAPILAWRFNIVSQMLERLDKLHF